MVIWRCVSETATELSNETGNIAIILAACIILFAVTGIISLYINPP